MKKNNYLQLSHAKFIFPLATMFAIVACETTELPSMPDDVEPEAEDEQQDEQLPNRQPNIVLMLADDMGFDDMSYRGNTSVSTPNLDSLAQVSTRFENFYVHSVSAPTRASLLTGRHFLRCGISGMHAGRDYMNLDEVTVAEALGDAGYKTGMWGKWHSGESNGYYPWQRGFDEAYMASLYHHDYNNGLYKGEYAGVQYNGTELSFDKSEGVWTDAKMADMAIDFMTRNKEDKFFAFIPFLAPHESWAAPDQYIERYRNMGQSENFATLNGMLSHLDYQVGRVLKAVDSLGLSENTIVIFMSDNGPNYNKSLLSESEWAQRNPSGYKGNKSRNTENGIHSPLFIYWKGQTIAVDNRSVLSVSDIFPTLCDLAGASIPLSCKPLDGKSFSDVISAPSINDRSRTLYISHWAPFNESGDCLDEVALTDDIINSINPELQHIGIRRGYDKLLLNEYNESDIAFWDLSSDYAEQNNIYENGTSTDRTKALAYKSELISWYSDILSDEGSFTTTTFQVGDSDYQYSVVSCYAPIDISEGLTNESLKLSGFDTSGEYATYSVNVLRDGNYDLRIYFNGDKAIGDEVFTVSTNLNNNINEASFNVDKTSSKWCKIALTSDVKTITLQLKESTTNEFALKYMRLEYLDD
ncbi:MAG: sulfatase-like hydrolase/transferase [Rikenellaceae bacterium]